MTLEEIIKAIKPARNIAVIGHISPDPDAIGAVCALSECLESIGKNVFRIFEDPIPSKLEFILNGKEVIDYFPKDKGIDLIVFCDISSTNLIGKKLLESFESLLGSVPSICIDHHESNDNYATFNYVDKKAAATCEIMYDVLKKLNFKITKSASDALYAGLSADTGSFRFSSTTYHTHLVAAKLLKAGAANYDISTTLWSSEPIKTMELKKVILNRLEYFFDNRLALSYITKDDMEKIGANKDYISGLVGNIRDIEGVVLAVLFYEEDENWKMSVRSKDEKVSTLPITTFYGGGGHFMASGARLSKELRADEIIKEVKRIAALELG